MARAVGRDRRPPRDGRRKALSVRVRRRSAASRSDAIIGREGNRRIAASAFRSRPARASFSGPTIRKPSRFPRTGPLAALGEPESLGVVIDTGAVGKRRGLTPRGRLSSRPCSIVSRSTRPLPPSWPVASRRSSRSRARGADRAPVSRMAVGGVVGRVARAAGRRFAHRRAGSRLPARGSRAAGRRRRDPARDASALVPRRRRRRARPVLSPLVRALILDRHEPAREPLDHRRDARHDRPGEDPGAAPPAQRRRGAERFSEVGLAPAPFSGAEPVQVIHALPSEPARRGNSYL